MRSANEMETQCNRLSEALPAQVYFPGSQRYAGTQNDFWSLQESQLAPACIVTPSTPEEVSITVSILSENEDCLFAVKGGGHAPAAGFASIDNGITVDMTQLDSVSVNADGTVASIGAGATWLQAYEFLDPLHLTVAGGRNAAVGVGGLTIGGTIHLQNRSDQTVSRLTSDLPTRRDFLFRTTSRMGL